VSTLTLVRHGQAETFQQEGAVLTPAGEQQAAALARWWLAKGVRFDDVYTGALVRQIQTEQVIAQCFREAGQPWPDATRDPAWNEYDAPGVMEALGVKFERGGPDEKRRFQAMFLGAMTRWIEGSIDAEGVELWPAFRDRVSGALGRLMAGPSRRRIAVFTSGGPIGFSVHFAMKAPARTFLDAHWRVRNTSMTEFVFDRERLTLDSFNCIHHLHDLGLHTYR